MDRKFVDEWMKGKTAADFNTIEFGGRLLWPDKIRKLKPGGDFEEIEVCLRVPRWDEELTAVAQASALLKERGLEREEHEAIYETAEQLAKVALAIREPKSPHGQWQPFEHLIGSKEMGVETRELFGVWQRVELYGRLQDARLAEIDEPTAVAIAHAVAEVRNLSPLVAIAGEGVDSCVISMATSLVRCLTDKSYSPLPATSTQGRSRKKS
jgi:hypothetical protein